MVLRPLALILLGCLLATPALAEVQVKKLETTGEAVMGPGMTPGQTKRAALDDARAKAVEVACGIDVSAAGLYSSGLEQMHMLQTLTKGFVVGESEITWSTENYQKSEADFPTVKYKVHMTVEVALPPKNARPAVTLSTSLNRPNFIPGEAAVITAEVSATAWVYVWNLMGNDMAVLLFPNDSQKDNLLKPGGKLLFPSASSGARLELYPVPGEMETKEVFLVAAFTEKLNLPGSLVPGKPMPTDALYRELLRHNIESAALVPLPYTVSGKD